MSSSRNKHRNSTFLASQEKRRKLFISRQKESRQHQWENIRFGINIRREEQGLPMLASSFDLQEDSMDIEKDRSHKPISRVKFDIDVCNPEWLMEVPNLRPIPASIDVCDDDEPESWVVRARPEGKSCLVHTCGANSVAHGISAAMLKVFTCKTALPKNCILECIFDDSTGVLYAVDVIMWKSQDLLNTTAEFRLFWLQTKLAECDSSVTTRNAKNEYPVLFVPWFECDYAGILAAYNEMTLPFQRDGLLFYHKFGYYQQGVTPLVLQWKDNHCCQYMDSIRTLGDICSNALELTSCSSRHPFRLEVVRVDGNIEQAIDIGEANSPESIDISRRSVILSTCDGVTVSRVPCSCIVSGHVVNLLPGDMVTCSAEFIGMEDAMASQETEKCLEEGDLDLRHDDYAPGIVPTVRGLIIQSVVSRDKSLSMAHSWSRIAFFGLRDSGRHVVTIEDILQKC